MARSMQVAFVMREDNAKSMLLKLLCSRALDHMQFPDHTSVAWKLHLVSIPGCRALSPRAAGSMSQNCR